MEIINSEIAKFPKVDLDLDTEEPTSLLHWLDPDEELIVTDEAKKRINALLDEKPN